MREVKVFEGGQTVTLGKVISVMGRTSTEVEMGLSRHPLKDWRMSETEQEKPAATTASQNSLSRFREAGMWDRPGIRVETSHWSRSTEILCSHWSRSWCCYIRQLSYAIKTQLKAPNAP